MPTLNDGINIIKALGDEKGWDNDIATKIYYGMIELAEAGDTWKHRGDPDYLKEKLGITPEEVPGAVAEELIDTILYCLHGFSCIGIYNADELFDIKMGINKLRNRIYLDDHTSLSTADHAQLTENLVDSQSDSATNSKEGRR